MNGKSIEKRISKNFERAVRDLAALKDDALVGLNWKVEQVVEGPRKSATIAAQNLNKSFMQGLHDYNAKAQEYIEMVPGDLGKKAAEYPWVVISMSVVAGLIVGTLLRLSRHS